MKKYTQKLLKILPYIAISLFVGVVSVHAGNLTPPGSPTKTMKSLSDLYELINTGTNTPSTDFTTPVSVVPTMYSLNDIYDLMAIRISDIDPNTIITGNTIFGVDGEAILSPIALTWQTGPTINLCWSHNQYEIDNSCTVGSGFTQTPDSLTTLGALEYCKYLNTNGTTLANTEQNIWHLPTIQEYQLITDYTLYNNATAVSGFAEAGVFWSSTENAENPNFAWYWGSSSGYIDGNDKNVQLTVRCVQ